MLNQYMVAADQHAADIVTMLAAAGLVDELGEKGKFMILTAMAKAEKEGKALRFALNRGQAPEAWRARRGRTEAEQAAVVIHRGRNFSVMGIVEPAAG